ncbi:putative delangin [Danaus plexippus plexippus]|uniref:Nipped-B protein n=1 Tax=Danaus plexippus plexippus TaxID=278856 RepID=A0A212EU65_DANPL|nr:nipped-B protein [Danaus plexippus plexippus]OWR45028.1 putative delangin [Danaus plexippus plexippus]
MNERDIPSVPITTLAGVASLTDLLPVLPLPTPLPSTLNNKSQLFHPRVAEEAAILLATRDDNLVSLLLQSLMQTSVQHIDLKDESIPNAVSPAPPQATPELLKAILHVNPNVFDQQQRNHWGNHLHASKLNGMSPSSTYNYASHNTVHSSPSSHGTAVHSGSMPNQQVLATPCQSSPHVNMGSPPSQARPGSQVNITAQNNVSPPWSTSNPSNIYTSPLSNSSCSNPQNGGFYNSLVQENRNFLTNIGDDKDPLSMSPRNMTEQQKQHLQVQDKNYEQVPGQSPAQASVAPSPLRQEPQVPQPCMGAPYAPPATQSTQEKQDPSRSTQVMNTRYPVVKLGRLSEGMLKKHDVSHDERSRKNSTVDSDSDDNLPLKAKSSSSTPTVDKEREAIDMAREKNWEAVKRKHEEASRREEAEAAIVRPKLRKVERRLVPVLEMLSVDELMETNTYQRFNKLIESVFETIDDDVIITDEMEGTDIPQDMLLPRYQLQELCSEAAKLKNLGAMEAIPSDRLVRLLNILEKNIRAAEKMSLVGDPEDSEEMRQIWMESALERVMCASDACLTALYIMTSPSMPKRIFLEDVIDRIIMFIKFQLNNTIYCVYDPVYSIQSTSKKKVDGRKRRGGGAGHASRRCGSSTRAVRELYTHAHECVTLLSELFAAHHLTDTTVLHASTVGVSPFFVENISELQLSALKLVTTIFTKYEQHRRLLLEDILASIARIPSSKHNLRSFQLSSDQHIQMLTALVLQLVQCVVTLPETLCKTQDKDKDKEKEKEHVESDSKKPVDKDLTIISKYEAAISVGGTFLTSFLNKCRSRNEEVDFRPLFENFVHDLLTTVNKPEWPATELLLSLLGTMLVKYMSDKSMEMSVRVASLEYLGLVASRLRRDSVTSRAKLATMDAVVRDIRAEEEKDGCQQQSLTSGLDEDEERTEFLQRVLLDYLAINGQKDQAWNCARHFYITQWYRDMVVQPKSSSPTKRPKNKSKKKYKVESSEEESDADDDSDGGIKESKADKKLPPSALMSAEKFKTIERRKHFFLEKIRPFRYQGGTQVQVMQSYIDYSGAELISQYLASKRSFSQSFDRYLRKILVILCENTIAIRTKAMKCLTMIVEADPAVLARPDMQIGVNRSFLDQSTAVREAAVDLVGKFVLSRPELIDKYYGMLSNRILDTGVSVRKRVIKILKDICIECPEFPKIPEICVKMIRRVNDEEGIRKLVMEVFQNMWFSPCPNSSRHGALDITAATADPLTRKVLNITDVVLSSRDMGLEWFQQLLMSLFKPKEDKDDSTKIIYQPPKSLLVACQQIVDCLIEHLLQLEETNTDGAGSSQRILACLSTLHLFAKIRPQLLVNHALTLQPYLSLKCQNQYEQQIMSTVASTLELVVPLMEHPSEVFLAQLEEDAVKLILQRGQLVIAACIACLAAIVNNLTHNYKLIRDVFNKYHGVLLQWKQSWQRNAEMTRGLHTRPHFRRALFIVGLLLRYFDFTESRVIEGLATDIKEQVYSTLMFFVGLEDEDFVSHTLKALGSVCVRHYEFMLRPELKEFYHQLLTSELAPIEMKADVLRNIEMYLQEEEQRMIRQDKEWSKRSKHENLKEMGDVSSGMASTVIQLYLKEILGSFLHASTVVRSSAMKVVQLVLAQGLVHPVQIVPYLICMSTDTEVTVSHTADKNLQEIDKKYPGFIHMKAQLGIKLSYQLQKILQNNKKGVIRGFRKKEQDDLPTALNGFLYSLLRNTRPQRRALILSLLKQFDDVSTAPLDQMLYLADNLSYFPFQVQDEPLFIIHHIDIIISTSGSNLLQIFREGLLKTGSEEKEPLDEEEDEEEAEALVARLPPSTRPLRDAMRQARGCLLLLVLKQHLKQLYGFTDAKISQYSPSESVKVYEKAVSRRHAPQFEPKATIAQLHQKDDDQELDERGRRRLIDDYLEVLLHMAREGAPPSRRLPCAPDDKLTSDSAVQCAQA